MADEPKQGVSEQSSGVNFELLEPPDGVENIYANLSHLSWTGMDLSVGLYQVVQPNRELPQFKDAPNHVLHRANITFSWAAAKTFHKMLGDVLERYEKANGPITIDFKAI